MENELRKRNQDEDEDENHGQLVKNILESKKQREFGSELNDNKGDFVRFLFYIILNFFDLNLTIYCRNLYYKWIYNVKKKKKEYKRK